jgi:hypothetical protein
MNLVRRVSSSASPVLLVTLLLLPWNFSPYCGFELLYSEASDLCASAPRGVYLAAAAELEGFADEDDLAPEPPEVLLSDVQSLLMTLFFRIHHYTSKRSRTNRSIGPSGWAIWWVAVIDHLVGESLTELHAA